MMMLEQLGCSRDKLAVGTGFFGRSYTLANPNENGLGAPIQQNLGGGNPGPYTRVAGFIAYYEVNATFTFNCGRFDGNKRCP